MSPSLAPSGGGRHRRTSSTWTPLPPNRQRGRHRVEPSELVRRTTGAVMALGLFFTTTALSSADEPRATIPQQVLAVDATIPLEPVETVEELPSSTVVADPVPTTTTTTTTTSQPLVQATGDEPAVVIDSPVVEEPGPSDILAHHSTTTLPGDTVTALIDESEGLWSSGLQMFSVVPEEALPDLSPQTPGECFDVAKQMPLEGPLRSNLIAQMTTELFECVLSAEGLDEVDPTSLRRWDGHAVWGFESLAQQLGAEAVVVAYCESLGFSERALTSNNPWGYGGLFQMGTTEFRRFDVVGGSRFDVVDNAYAAVNYLLYQYRNRAGWGGWSPWAVVNTNFDGVNDQVKVPILPRFTSTQEGFEGRRGPELPEWAVDPWSFRVPEWNGCPYNGSRWAPSERL